MPSPAEIALHSLVPTISALPQELLDLCASVFAQSRTHAASLKPEEEIARTYVCAHIACERLAKKLALDVAKPTPPCKPRVYAKLKSYLETALATPATPKRRRRVEDKLTSGVDERDSARRASHVWSDDATPTKSPAVTSTPVSRQPRGRRGETQTTKSESDHRILMRDLRFRLCATFEALDAEPHVARAEDDVLSQSFIGQDDQDYRLAKRRRTDGINHEQQQEARIQFQQLPGLAIALYLFVTARMAGNALHGADYDARLNRAVNEIQRSFRKTLSHQSDWPDEARVRADVSHFMNEAQISWTTRTWYTKIPTPDQHGTDESQQGSIAQSSGRSTQPAKTPLRRAEKHRGPVDKVQRADDDDDELGPAGLLPGLGTMFQPALDWLSDERRAGYARWKADVLREAQLLEQGA